MAIAWRIRDEFGLDDARLQQVAERLVKETGGNPQILLEALREWSSYEALARFRRVQEISE